MNYVLEHAEAVYGYERYLEGIEEQARLISHSSLFGGADLFSKRNAALIPEKYRRCSAWGCGGGIRIVCVPAASFLAGSA